MKGKRGNIVPPGGASCDAGGVEKRAGQGQLFVRPGLYDEFRAMAHEAGRSVDDAANLAIEFYMAIYESMRDKARREGKSGGEVLDDFLKARDAGKRVEGVIRWDSVVEGEARAPRPAETFFGKLRSMLNGLCR